MKGFQLSTSLARSTSAFALAAGLAMPGTAWAQPASAGPDQSSAATAQGDTADDEIVVTGIRASMQRAMDIKRDSQGVVDAVSAEDIGKFPDTNLAESLQRIPGVSIDRRNGEGSQVTVRGFGPQFNLVTVNGRQLATSDVNAVGGDQSVDFARATSRSFDFSNLASEGVSRLEVYKTGRAAIQSGGIGAAINIVTQRPLDGPQDGFRGSVAAKALYDTSNSGFKLNPELTGIATWSDPNDTVGVTVFGAYQKRESAAASATSNDWNMTTFANMPGRGAGTVITNAPTNPQQYVTIPNDSRYHYSQSEHERINGQATLQFRPMESLTFTADALYAQNKLREERSDQTNWFNRPFDHVTFDGNPVVASAIYLDEGSLYATKDVGFEQQYRATKSTLQSYGLNMNWEVLDGLTLNLDGNHSSSKSVPNARNGASATLVSFGAPVVDKHSVDYSGPIPIQRYTVNDALGNKNGVLDIGDLGTQVQRTNSSRQKHRINELRADLGWDFGGGGRFDLGTSWIDSKMTSVRSQTQQTLGDWGITRPGDVQQLAGSIIQQYCLACKFDHYTPGDAQIAFRGNALDLYDAFAQAYIARGNAIQPSAADNDEVREKIWSTYAQFSWNGELMGRKASLIAGARFENTKITSPGFVTAPLRIEWDSDNDFTRVVVPGQNVVTVTSKGDYSNLLPSIDFRLEPMDNVVARVSYSKTMARADYGNLFASQSVNPPNRPTALGGRPTGAQGNPSLKPLVSDNFDVSLEYYFNRSSYVSAGFFYKKVKNFVGQSQVSQQLFGLRDPSSGAAGSRSGTAQAELSRLGVPVTDVTLFTMSALLVETGNIVTASQQFQTAYANQATFQKFVDDVLGRTDVIANAADPFFTFSLTTPINNRQGNVHGFELQGQYFFGDTGFGIAGSFTKVYGDIKFDPGANPDENVFALVGLSDSANITGIYEKGGLSARVAYNWRGKFLQSVNRGAYHHPVYFEPFGTLDLNISYDVMPNLALSLEAVNILGEPVRSYARAKSELWFAQELHPRILAGARFKF
jgi:TonB-dependent receptor